MHAQGLRRRRAGLDLANSRSSARVAFCQVNDIGARDRGFRRSMAGLHHPLSTLHRTPRDARRITRGQCGFVPPSLQRTFTAYSLPVSRRTIMSPYFGGAGIASRLLVGGRKALRDRHSDLLGRGYDQRCATMAHHLTVGSAIVVMLWPSVAPALANDQRVDRGRLVNSGTSRTDSNAQPQRGLMTLRIQSFSAHNRFLANALPECDFKYLSNSRALCLSEKAQYQTNFQGENLAV